MAKDVWCVYVTEIERKRVKNQRMRCNSSSYSQLAKERKFILLRSMLDVFIFGRETKCRRWNQEILTKNIQRIWNIKCLLIFLSTMYAHQTPSNEKINYIINLIIGPNENVCVCVYEMYFYFRFCCCCPFHTLSFMSG